MKTLTVKILPVFLVMAFAFFSCSKKDAPTPLNPEPSVAAETYAASKVASQVYPLHSVSGSGVSGTATFQKAGPHTLVTIELTGTSDGDMHPSHIHFNSAAQGGGIAISLRDIDGGSGRSNTLVKEMDDGTPITYDELLNFDGYINVHLSTAQLGVILAQGDIGSNF